MDLLINSEVLLYENMKEYTVIVLELYNRGPMWMSPGNEWRINYVWEDVMYTMIELDVGYEERIQKEDPE